MPCRYEHVLTTGAAQEESLTSAGYGAYVVVLIVSAQYWFEAVFIHQASVSANVIPAPYSKSASVRFLLDICQVCMCVYVCVNSCACVHMYLNVCM
jgi:hypothetical protein